MTSEGALHAHARWAYEGGRLRTALLRAAWLVPTGVLAHAAGTGLEAALAGTAALVVVTAALHWRGQDHARGARAGLIAGLAPFAIPLLARGTGVLCTARVCAILPVACVAGGLLGGVVLGLARPRLRATPFWAAALCTTLAAGALGCLWAGLSGILGLALGVALGAAPVLLLRRT
jgi:hypothetical protein